MTKDFGAPYTYSGIYPANPPPYDNLYSPPPYAPSENLRNLADDSKKIAHAILKPSAVISDRWNNFTNVVLRTAEVISRIAHPFVQVRNVVNINVTTKSEAQKHEEKRNKEKKYGFVLLAASVVAAAFFGSSLAIHNNAKTQLNRLDDMYSEFEGLPIFNLRKRLHQHEKDSAVQDIFIRTVVLASGLVAGYALVAGVGGSLASTAMAVGAVALVAFVIKFAYDQYDNTATQYALDIEREANQF